MGFAKFFKKHSKEIKHILLCMLGSFVLAFGTAAFLIPAEIVAGGTSGVGMLASYFLRPALGEYMALVINNIIVWSINISLLIISFFFIGKKFAAHTLVSTLCFPAFYSLMTLTPMLTWLTQFFVAKLVLNYALRVILAGVLAGVTIGVGVSLTFVGDGSSGGLDVLYFLGFKYLKIKQSISSFVLDATIIIVYATATADHLPEAGMGVASAFISAIMIEIIYVRPRKRNLIHVTTKKYKEMLKYFSHAKIKANLINSAKKNESRIVEINLTHKEFRQIRDDLHKIDARFLVSTPSAQYLANKKFLEDQNGTKI